ncbi:pyridoxamine 5'-phosphate oxidase family protein [Nocardia panacis]|uniref:Pyridoxamine 5'-phosphate oxidase family protein n=1 Tax=Nocardia panacis TaxID=2340916 RepID=A0A3A4KGH6_9NOCA|nr:pyridoxamine 5'-phosphate oxidase family protein [Nocardia panacis]RJO72531.1 pyridoxamine 5'-phosphate oxidase family protein [Nocardia panacis]
MTSSTTFSSAAKFSEIRGDFTRLTEEIGWCVVSTVDTKERPRSRILHVNWEVDDRRPIGWIGTGRSPVKTAHLARNPYVSCTYWTPAQDVVYADCRASWVDDRAGKQHVWEVIAAEAGRKGFDPYLVWKGGIDDPNFDPLCLEPWRIQVTLQDLAHGEIIGSSRVWHSKGIS